MADTKHEMTGAELASLLKGQLGSNMLFNGLIGVDDPQLHLSEEDINWWRNAKFGLFIHWGIYSAIGKGEWAYFNEHYSEDDYRKLAEDFRPDKSADEICNSWLEAAEIAGMKYAVMVTRHHDGYALWDSHSSYKDFTSVKCGSGEDYVRAFTDACHKHNIHTGLYYSPMDWRFEGYFDPQGKPQSARLMKEQAHAQVEELCSKYGKIDILWYDGGWLAHKGTDADAAEFWESIRLNKMVRSYNPKTMVSPRSGYKGDFECDEGTSEVKGQIVPVPWEKSMSVSSAWGYIPHDSYVSADFVIKMLVNAVCRDGNLLLNAGPDKNGNIPSEAMAIFKTVGKWLEKNGEAVYGTRAGIWQPVDNVFGSVKNNKNIYLHILDVSSFNKIELECGNTEIVKAEKLSGEKVEFTQENGKLVFSIDESLTDEIDTIIRLEIK